MTESNKRIHARRDDTPPFRLVRLYRANNGIWRYERVGRNGRIRWSSLHTRDEAKARGVYERMEAGLKRWLEEEHA